MPTFLDAFGVESLVVLMISLGKVMASYSVGVGSYPRESPSLSAPAHWWRTGAPRLPCGCLAFRSSSIIDRDSSPKEAPGCVARLSVIELFCWCRPRCVDILHSPSHHIEVPRPSSSHLSPGPTSIAAPARACCDRRCLLGA